VAVVKPGATQALRTRDLATILRTYRRLNRLSQERPAQLLGFDKTYISMIETRRRVIADLGNLRHIAHALAIPGHVLGVTESDDATFAAMMQFAGSVLTFVRGRAQERARYGCGGRTLAACRSPGSARSGGILALTMHGNELRKSGRVGAAIARLQRAVAESTDADSRATASAMLARAAGEARRAELFDTTMRDYRMQLEQTAGAGMLTNEFTFREIHLRGLVATGRAAAAARLMSHPTPPRTPVAPQWAAIERITIGDVLLAANERMSAAEALLTGLSEAESTGLPHQAQRALAIADAGRLLEVAEVARSVVTRLQIARREVIMVLSPL
jgi:transcriptional regulator with XRE-family HTH domain